MDTQTLLDIQDEDSRVVTSPPDGGNPPPYAFGPKKAPFPFRGVNYMPMGDDGIIVTEQMAPRPTRATCKSCLQEVVTITKSKASKRTHSIAGVMCIICLWPFMWIPYCVGSCMNTEHYCPNCNSYIGSHFN